MNWNITLDGRDAGIFYGNHKEAREYIATTLPTCETITLWSENGDFYCDFRELPEIEDEAEWEAPTCYCDPEEGHDCAYFTGGTGYL